jgi:hypothetical protein
MRLWTDYGMPDFGNDAILYGTEGWICDHTAHLDDDKKVQIKAEDYGIEPTEGIFENFITAVRNDDPSMLNSPIEVGGVLSNLCNLGNIGTRLGNAALTYDPDSRRITKCSKDIDKANAMLTKQYRRPYTLAYTG